MIKFPPSNIEDMPYQLYNNIGKRFGFGKSSSPYDLTANSSGYEMESSISSILIYVTTIAIILTVILFLIHYTLYPIFSLQPGDPGIITIPGFADNEVFWTTKTFTDLSDVATKIQTNTYNYSLSLDIAIQNPYISQTNGYTVLFSRGGAINPKPDANSSIKGTINNYNVAIALAPGNTDLIVSILNSDGNPDNVLIPNIPVKDPFRIGVVIMGTVFEVYLNGKLVRTKRYSSGAPGNYAGPFHPPDGSVARSVRVGNLLLWNRIASSQNIRYARPVLMTGTEDDNGSSNSCSTFSGSLASFEDSLSKNASAIASSATTSLGAMATASSSAVSSL
jgi:hypothetical protein